MQEEVDRLNDEITGRDAKNKELTEQLNKLQEKFSRDKELTELFKIQGIIFGCFVVKTLLIVRLLVHQYSILIYKT